MKVYELIDALGKVDPNGEVVAPTWDRFMCPVQMHEWTNQEVALFPVAPEKEVDPKAVIPAVCFENGEFLELEADTWIHFGELIAIFHRNGNIEIDSNMMRFEQLGKENTDE